MPSRNSILYSTLDYPDEKDRIFSKHMYIMWRGVVYNHSSSERSLDLGDDGAVILLSICLAVGPDALSVISDAVDLNPIGG